MPLPLAFSHESKPFFTDRRKNRRTYATGIKIISNTPMGKYGQPEDLQGAVLFLLSDMAKFITGIIVPVDGGYSAYGGV
jgi:NAD(P)-dependent dehydrogenase (short-subunit alcohol dehydrogenase family)